MINAGKDAESQQPFNGLSNYGLLIEGGAVNLINSSDHITNKILERYQSSFSLLGESELGSVPTWSFTLPANESIDFLLPISFAAGASAITASCYCWSIPRGVGLQIVLDAPGHLICRTFKTQEPNQRFEITLPIPINLNEVVVGFKISNSSSSDCMIRMAVPCVERGAFASSPVLPGAYRAPDLIDIKDGSIFFDESQIGAVVLAFYPQLEYFQWSTENDGCIFGAFSEDGANGVDISLSASAGQIVLTVTENFQIKKIFSDIRPKRGVLSGVGLTWDGGSIQLFADGHTVGHMDGLSIDFRSLTKIRLGNHPLNECCASNILLKRAVFFKTKFAPWEIGAIFAEIDPKRYWYLTPILNRLVEAKSQYWDNDLVSALLKIPSRWQSLPPLWTTDDEKLDEGVFRDDVCSVLEIAGFRATAEAKCVNGRTDLLVIAPDGQRTRVEFKIWGRHDYAEVPLKPIKYMTDDEISGVVVMLNNNKSSIDREYVKRVLIGPTDCRFHTENPFFGVSDVFHFTSEHHVSDRRVHILHIVFNTKVPAVRAGFIEQLEMRGRVS